MRVAERTCQTQVMESDAGAAQSSARIHQLGVDRWLIETLVALLLALIATGAAWEWNAANDSQSAFPRALFYAPGASAPAGYERLTYAVLNVRQPGRVDLGRSVRYAPAAQVSTGPFVVSVHAIDASTWAAVALGSNGTCYAILDTAYGPHYEYGSTYYARFRRGFPCRGSLATRATVRDTVFPP